jgi:hypothetical protein
VPFPESSLNEEAGKVFMEDYEKYFKIAKIYTSVHAIAINKETETNSSNNTISVCQGEAQQGFITPTASSFFNQGSQNFTPEFANSQGNNCQSMSGFDFNLLRHSRSVCIKSSNNLGNFYTENKQCDNRYTLLKLERKDSSSYFQTDSKILPKPSLNSLPFINRSNSLYFNSNSENMNFNILANTNILHNNFNCNSAGPSQTPKSKKEEIKKWLSRI